MHPILAGGVHCLKLEFNATISGRFMRPLFLHNRRKTAYNRAFSGVFMQKRSKNADTRRPFIFSSFAIKEGVIVGLWGNRWIIPFCPDNGRFQQDLSAIFAGIVKSVGSSKQDFRFEKIYGNT